MRILSDRTHKVCISVLLMLLSCSIQLSDTEIRDIPGFTSYRIADIPKGSWEGEIQMPARPVYVRLEFKTDGNGTVSGLIHILGRTLPFQSLKYNADTLNGIIVPGANGFSLILNYDGKQLTGFVNDAGESYPVQLDPIPEYPVPANRSEAWRQDISTLSERFIRYDYSFSPDEKELFIKKLYRLFNEIPDLNDDQIITSISAAIALSGNAHTRLYLLRNRTELRRLPVRMWWFSDGLYVVSTNPSNEKLLGCRVDLIEGVPVRQVRDMVSEAFAGNSSWIDYKSTYYMSSPEILHGFGIASDPEQINFTLSDCRFGSFDHALTPLPLQRSAESVEAWKDLSPYGEKNGWTQIFRSVKTSPDIYLQNPDLHYSFKYIEEDSILYFQYNRASEMDEIDLDSFGKELLEEFEQQEVGALVIDLRFNTGGNLALADELMTRLQETSKSIPRYVIIGRATFSAGIAHAAKWAEDGNITLIGEEVGDEPDYWSEGGNIILPNSGYYAHFANAFHSYSERSCPENVPCLLDLNAPSLQPDIYTDLSWKKYLSGIDPAMEVIRSLLSSDLPENE